MSSKRFKSRRVTAGRAREQKAAMAGGVKFAVALGILIAVAAAYLVVVRGNRRLDEITLCPAAPTSVTVLLVDVTDPMNGPQRQDFRNQLSQLKNSIPRYGRLVVARVDATASDLLRPVIVRCNPGTAQDANELTGNPGKLQRMWSEHFEKPLEDTFNMLGNATEAEQSPILESVQSVALTELKKPGSDGIPKRLILASDLLQNTPSESFYKRVPDPTEFVVSASFRRARTDLRGVDVELWQLQRVDGVATQPRALSKLWERIISEQGGSVSRIYNVSG